MEEFVSSEISNASGEFSSRKVVIDRIANEKRATEIGGFKELNETANRAKKFTKKRVFQINMVSRQDLNEKEDLATDIQSIIEKQPPREDDGIDALSPEYEGVGITISH